MSPATFAENLALNISSINLKHWYYLSTHEIKKSATLLLKLLEKKDFINTNSVLKNTNVYSNINQLNADKMKSNYTSLPNQYRSDINISMWNWHTENWIHSPSQFLTKLKQKGINQVYLQLNIVNGHIQNQDKLFQLLDIAAKKKMSIIAVEGAPDMITDSGLKNAIERNKVIKKLCQIHNPCLAGIQYDIEPYLLAEYAQNKSHIWQRWNNAIKTLSETWHDKIEIVLPFWLLDIEDGKNIVEKTLPYSSKLIIMAYRTKLAQIYTISSQWLTWGELNNKKIVIALESSIIEDETSENYNQYPQSDESQTTSLNQSISFMGEEKKLFSTINQLSTYFSQWSSFERFALNGLESK